MTTTRLSSVLGVGVSAAALFLSGCGSGSGGISSSAGAGSSGAVTSTSAEASSESSAGTTSPSTGGSSGRVPSASAKGADPAGYLTGRGAGQGSGEQYRVAGVVDGDTIKVMVGGKKVTVRLIGLDTPETKKPHVPVQCYGKEASSRMQSLVQSKSVQLEADSNQGGRDKYGRLLRHVFVGGSTNVALALIAGGYGEEYMYSKPYHHRLEYLAAQAQAKAAGRGTWGPPCNGFHKGEPSASATSTSASASASAQQPGAGQPASPHASASGSGPSGCTIKGNINSSGKKIAHAPGSDTYDKTKIDTSKGERWFCSEAEAVAAGWRMAQD